VGPPFLTFDDGPSDLTGPILGLLADYGLKACFFVVGNRVLDRPALVRRASAEGHSIGSHTWDHADLTSLPEEADVIDQLERGSEAIAAVLGVRPTLFRCPWLRVNDRVLAVAGGLGLTHVGADVDARDYDPNHDVEAVVRSIVAASPGATVLLHDHDGDIRHGPDARPKTVEAVARALPLLRAAGRV
jgi:peptidoglycan/xylan/chitin deacetylase (PgdA/CDA1 family)